MPMIAITSEAATMSKPVSRGMPWVGPPRPLTMLRRLRSFMSTARRQATPCGAIRHSLP